MVKRREARFDPVRRMRYDAGSPALDLVATVGRRGGDKGVERLNETNLKAWLSRMNLQASPADLQDLRVLREVICRLLDAAMTQKPSHPDDIATLNEFASRPSMPPRLAVSELGDFEVDHIRPDALGLLARDAIHILGDPRRRNRLRRCDAPDCRMFYLDNSQGRRRRWCSMQRCGNRAKAAAHRAAASDPSRSPQIIDEGSQ